MPNIYHSVCTGQRTRKMEFFNNFVNKVCWTDCITSWTTTLAVWRYYKEAVDHLWSNPRQENSNTPFPGASTCRQNERYLTEGNVFKNLYSLQTILRTSKRSTCAWTMTTRPLPYGPLQFPGVGRKSSGSQREERLELLEKRMDELGLKKKTTRVRLSGSWHQMRRHWNTPAMVWASDVRLCT